MAVCGALTSVSNETNVQVTRYNRDDVSCQSATCLVGRLVGRFGWMQEMQWRDCDWEGLTW